MLQTAPLACSAVERVVALTFMRLNQYLASAGLGSRRSVEELITAGEIRVNGKVCTSLSTRIGPSDRVEARGRRLSTRSRMVVALNKPAGIIVSAADEKSRRTVFDLLPEGWPRLAHVGRLDKESEGLLLLTNDGSLVHQLTHPGFKVEKEYVVVTDKEVDPAHIGKLLSGVYIFTDEKSARPRRARAAAARLLCPNTISITLEQGLKRQVRLMLARLGYRVQSLQRIRIGGLRLGRIPRGEWKILAPRDIDVLLGGGSRPSTSRRAGAAKRQMPSANTQGRRSDATSPMRAGPR